MTAYVVLGGVVLAGILLVVVALLARWMLAPNAPIPATLRTYESGVDPVGTGWAQVHVRYLAYAFLYVIFAVDAVFLFPWAYVLRDAHLGVASLVEMGIFVGVLVVGLAHTARRGLLHWT